MLTDSEPEVIGRIVLHCSDKQGVYRVLADLIGGPFGL